MPIAIDAISQRKLVMVKQLYQIAFNQSELRHSTINRITSVIGFDLTVETLLKTVVSALDPSKLPAEQFNGLLDQCEKLLAVITLPSIPHRPQILYVHSIRNDAQHKARYPNETDISDCRTYTRDFCRDLIANVWSISFDSLSSIDLIDDSFLRDLLHKSLSYISNGDYRKAVVLAENAFHWASLAIFDVIPRSSIKIYSDRYQGLKSLVEDINRVISTATNDATYYAALFSSGINLVAYKRYKEMSPITQYVSESQMTDAGETRSRRIQIYWNRRTPSEEDTLWLLDFAVNAITNWQAIGLQPSIKSEQIEIAQSLLNFGSDVIEIP